MKWLHPHLGSTTRDGRPPHAYMVALRHVAVTLDRDPAWQAWWRRGGVRACELGIVAEGRFDHLRPSADIRRAGDRVRANFTCSPPRHDGDAADLCPFAVAEVTGMFEVIREAIGLPALPPVPPLPALPPNARAVEVTTKPLRRVPRDIDQHGYQTLAQIQEFFA
jgi:hypothetical protein